LYNNIEYFVDENKYIMERVAMFSLLLFIEQKNIAKTKYKSKHNTK